MSVFSIQKPLYQKRNWMTAYRSEAPGSILYVSEKEGATLKRDA